MQNVILIENKTKRQKEEYSGISLDTFNDVFYNAIDEEYNISFQMLSQTAFNLPYDVVIVHENAFEGVKIETIEKLKQYCKIQKKLLVLFSGGIERIVYNQKIGVMYLPSRVMYKNLMEFLVFTKKGERNIKILAYGKNWKINALNSVFKEIKKLAKEMKSTEKIRTKIFRKEVGFDLIETLIPNIDVLNKTFLEVADIGNITKFIKAVIKDQI